MRSPSYLVPQVLKEVLYLIRINQDSWGFKMLSVILYEYILWITVDTSTRTRLGGYCRILVRDVPP